MDRLVDFIALGAAGIIRAAVTEKGERPVQIKDHALAHRHHFLRHYQDTEGETTLGREQCMIPHADSAVIRSQKAQ